MNINEAAQAMSGNWVKLTSKADGVIEGRVVAFETRPMTFEGDPIKSRKTGQQRTEWVLTVLPDDGGEPVKFSLKESGQRAISEAIKAAGGNANTGDRLKISVKTDKETERSQPVYQARWTHDSTPLAVPAAEEEEPF